MKRLSDRVRMAGLLVLVLAAAVVALACGQEAVEPAPAATSEVSAPAATPGTGFPTATSVQPTAPPEPTADPTDIPTPTTPAPTQPPVSDSQEGSGGGSLVLLRSRSVATPSGSGRIGGFHLSPAPQAFAAEGSLTVSAIGSVTAAADEAYVVVFPEMNYGPSGPEQLSAEDRDEIRANLVSIGVAEEAVEFDHLARYEPTSISVEVDVNEYATLGDSIVEQVEDVVRRAESSGVRFSLSEENCDQAVSLARREAVPAAEKAADDLADALGVVRGDVVGALEYPLQSNPYGLPGTGLDPCGGQTAFPYSVLLPFDSDPEVEVSVGLQVAYELH